MIAKVSFVLLVGALVSSSAHAQTGAGHAATPTGITPTTSAARVQDEAARLFARFEREPSIADVQIRALRFFRVHPDVMDGLVRRARVSMAIPKVRFAYTYDTGDENEDYVGTGASLMGQAASNDTARSTHTVGAEVTWDLSHLIYDPAELLSYEVTPRQVEIIKEVTRIFYERREHILTQVLNPPADVRARAALRLAIDERTALLDAMTGGWYRRTLLAALATIPQ